MQYEKMLDTFPYNMCLGRSGSVQRQCIRYARGYLFRIWTAVHPGTTDTLLNVGLQERGI
jgi:hypothetical protein